MTILDAVNAVVGFESPNDDIPSKAILDVGLLPGDAYTFSPTLSIKVDTAAVAVLMALKIISKVSEGGFSVAFDDKAADKNIYFLCGRSGIPNPLEAEAGDNIISVSDRW